MLSKNSEKIVRKKTNHKFKKKLLYIIILFFTGLIVIYWNDIKTILIHEKEYIVYELDRDILNYNEEYENSKSSYPKKFILNDSGNQIFGISLSKSENIIFENQKLIEINDEEYNKLKIRPIDSVVKLLSKKRFEFTIDYYVVLLDKRTNKKYITKTSPSYTIE